MMAPLTFLTPSIAVGSIGVGLVCRPLITAMYGAIGAIQGAVGVYALTTLSYTTCSITTAATIGFLAGAAIAAPFAIAVGLKAIFDFSSDEEDHGFLTSMAFFSLNIAIIFLASLVMSTGLFLGITPAAAIGTGAVVTNFAIETVKDVSSCVMSRI